MDILSLLKDVQSGARPVEEALRILNREPVHDLGYARVDLDRPRRCNMPEVIYCAGKTAEQVDGIIRSMTDAGHNVLGSRMSPGQYAYLEPRYPDAVYHPVSRVFTLDTAGLPEPTGLVPVVCAGTSDLAVAEEAELMAQRMGARTERIVDVGVAGLHRLMEHLDLLRQARVIVVAAGMEGALPSVVGGLVPCPLIAVPTSVGYGTNLNGMTPLFAMLNSCVPGMSVVNIDNGIGAGSAAAMINRLGGDGSNP